MKRIIEAVTYRYAQEKVKAMTFEQSDTILVTNKNFTTLVIDFCNKQDIEIATYENYVNIKIMMVKAGYDFDLSEKQQQRKMAQLVVRYGDNQTHKYYAHAIDLLHADIRFHNVIPYYDTNSSNPTLIQSP